MFLEEIVGRVDSRRLGREYERGEGKLCVACPEVFFKKSFSQFVVCNKERHRENWSSSSSRSALVGAALSCRPDSSVVR